MADFFSEQTDTRGRRITMGVFVALVALLVMASNVVPLPSRESVERSLDLVMLEAMAMAEATEVEEEAEEPAVDDDPPQPEASLENLDGILSAFSELIPAEELVEESILPDRGETESIALQSNVGLDFGVEEELDVFGDSRPGEFSTDLLPQSRGGTWTLQPDLTSGPAPRSDARLSSGIGSEKAELTSRSERPERLVETIIGEQDDTQMISEDIFRENAVVRWMQDRLNALDRPVRTLFEQKSNDLTVNEPVIIGAKSYHLQMMYSPVTRTLHIAWIDGEDLFYFVDPALQYHVNYFEQGVVERASSMEEVVLLETEELPAMSPQAVREFEIFLNWWKPQIESDLNG